ncbi:PREDICTED: probably inactive leucine-rich repeat receptor-like protein kinase At2g25790 [Theobroma cacao]|uniref:non-specific serine/threonine protein kinase n=1 Tax=Theobroma cacao TaxID=3641 RepID=A0AB32WW96_THECC|nr:PREDICTED: probably inactive leucine-rich repeat receptor-like protein kinase At2g25790 [Theobroma cacao]
MAKKGAKACPPVLLFVLMFLFFNSRASHGQELELLLSFKSSIHDPSGFLSKWDSSATFCQWHGITCNNLSHVDTVDLSAKNLSGKLVSPSIFQLPYIQTLNLSSNQLDGEIPLDIYSSSSLRFLNLSNNNFTGQIPSGSISRLEILDLSNNMLSGRIPQEIGSFYSLKFLDLGGNVLVGKIPISISNITTLQFLTLASNQLVGPIPREVGKMKSLKWIYLGYNNLSGEIPKEIGMLTSLNHLDLVYNNLTGEIPSSLGNLGDLQYLFLYQNKLTGSIPKSIFGLKKLVSLDLSDNSLSGEVPELIIQLQNLEILHLFSNRFTGKIPNALTSLPRLQVLQLWSNSLSGEIPTSLGRHNNLTVLDLSGNNLTGRIPDGLCSSGRLFKLILFSNSLEGVIPKNLSTCTSLQRVRLQSNRLSGELSSEFTKLPLVYYLDISNNNLSGNIGERKWDMPSLEMLNLARNRFSGKLPHSFGRQKIENLDLSGNELSGSIPRSFGSLTELMQLSLCGNKLTGEIPEELSSCKKLVSLDFSHNQLSGHIPSGFSEMPVLGQLDLSENQLSGEVPPKLGKLESLVQVNISYNHLHGSLPSTGAFLAINASAVAGNDLCGGDDTSGLSPCKKVKNPTWRFFVACSLAALVLLSLAAFGLVFIRGRNNLELKRVENEDGIWELQFFDSKVSKSVTIDDIILSAKEVNVISRGQKLGTPFKGKSVVNDLQFVVKEMTDVSSIPPSFWSEIAQIGKLHHPNIVKLIGICRSNKGAYLVYEYIEGKILGEILHNLSWERRRTIAIGIAKALRFLHSYCSPGILVGNMSPERVIIDGKDEPRLTLGLPGLGCVENKRFIASAYVAPEARESKDITEKSDIYGFGLILIELLTGKSPADAEFGVQRSMVEWARYCYSDCHLDVWVDPIIRAHASNNQNQIVVTMNLALHCTAGDPTARPCASDVSKTLESAFRISSCVPGLKFSSPV